MKFKVFGPRVAIKPIAQTYSGKLVMPQSAAKIFDLGQVVAVGDGKAGDKQVPMHVKEGDNVVFQANTMVAFNCMYKAGAEKGLFLLQQDLIATLSGTEIKLEDFRVLGNWILLDLFEDAAGLIEVPDAAKKPTRYRVQQVGQDVTKVSAGQEVVVEQTRVGKIALNSTDYGFINEASVLAVVE